jgi:hypothetical protein
MLKLPEMRDLNPILGRPEVITLCGSSRFKEQHIQVMGLLTLKGKIVIPMGMYGHLELSQMDMEGDVKVGLDELHKRKIDISDSIFVVNPIVTCCVGCGKPCEWVGWMILIPGRDTNRVSDCCKAKLEYKPYIGDSTREEIAYALNLQKNIHWLNTE